MSTPPSPRFILDLGRMLLLVLAVWATSTHVATAQGRTRRAAERTAMGQALVRAGNPGSAIAYFREAIQIDPAYVPAYLGLGELYRAAGRDSDALEVVRAGLLRRPRSVPLAMLLAGVVEPGDPAQAAAILSEAVSREPGSVEAQRARAELARRRGAFAEALASYRAVVNLTEDATDPASAALCEEARRYVAALRLLVRDVDPPSRCVDTPVRRALAGC